jgi:hypothetical protein
MPSRRHSSATLCSPGQSWNPGPFHCLVSYLELKRMAGMARKDFRLHPERWHERALEARAMACVQRNGNTRPQATSQGCTGLRAFSGASKRMESDRGECSWCNSFLGCERPRCCPQSKRAGSAGLSPRDLSDRSTKIASTVRLLISNFRKML